MEKNLVAGENIIYQAGMSRAVLIGPAIFAGIGAIIDIIILMVILIGPANPGEFIAIAVVTLICGLPLLSKYVKYRTTEYVVTNKRIVLAKGWINKTTFDISLKKCDGVTYKRTLGGKIFNYADVALSSTGDRLMIFSSVANPEEFKNQIHAAISF